MFKIGEKVYYNGIPVEVLSIGTDENGNWLYSLICKSEGKVIWRKKHVPECFLSNTRIFEPEKKVVLN